MASYNLLTDSLTDKLAELLTDLLTELLTELVMYMDLRCVSIVFYVSQMVLYNLLLYVDRVADRFGDRFDDLYRFAMMFKDFM